MKWNVYFIFGWFPSFVWSTCVHVEVAKSWLWSSFIHLYRLPYRSIYGGRLQKTVTLHCLAASTAEDDDNHTTTKAVAHTLYFRTWNNIYLLFILLSQGMSCQRQDQPHPHTWVIKFSRPIYMRFCASWKIALLFWRGFTGLGGGGQKVADIQMVIGWMDGWTDKEAVLFENWAD